MFSTKLPWIIAVFGYVAVASKIKLPDEPSEPKTEGRQFSFPQETPSSPNFQSSPNDVYYVDASIQVGNREQQQSLVQAPQKRPFNSNPKFSPNLNDDLYNQLYGAQQQSSNQYQQQQQHQHQQQYTQHQQQSQPQYVQSSKPHPGSVFPANINEVYFNDIGQQNHQQQQQYSPQSQQYVDNSNFVYSQPPKIQSQQSFGPSFSPAVTGHYQHLNRPPSSASPSLHHQRPGQSLYSPSHHYGGNVRPVYQSQHNFRPQSGYDNEGGGGIMESISNFITNVGQGAAGLFSSANRPPINQYQPPTPINAITPNRPPYSSQFGDGSGGLPNPVNQFSKAIEEITRNDDFQCIPKVICQMVGSQRRQPSILGSPIFSAIISALPSTSAGMVYGRAALLGLVSGEHNCQTAYPKCPRHEDDLLYYLNNHRGGFFRFFNGGAAFGDDTNYNYRPNQYQQQNQQHNYNQQNYNQQNHYQQQHQQQHQHQQPQAEESSLQTGLAALQGIAEAINGGGGINLSNLASNGNPFGALAGLLNGGDNGVGSAGPSSSSNSGGFDLSSLASNAGLIGNLASLVGGGNRGSTKPIKAPVDDKGESLTELVGNLLTGFVGQRFAGRKIGKRSIEVFDDENGSFRPNKLRFDEKNSSKKPEETDEIEPRILNSKSTIDSEDYDRRGHFTFQSHRGGKKVQFMDRITAPTPIPEYAGNDNKHYVSFQKGESNNNDEFRIPTNHRSPKVLKFQNNDEPTNYKQQYGNNYNQRPIQFDDYGDDNNRGSKMIFPDRTGTGNLKFDPEEFNRDAPSGNRYGKILNSGNNYAQNVQNGNRVLFDQNNDSDRYSEQNYNYRPSSSSNSNGNYQNSNYNRPNYNQNDYNYNQNQNQNQNNRRYPANGRYDNNSNSNRQRHQYSSQNTYVTNSQGQIEYYINPQGKKVYGPF